MQCGIIFDLTTDALQGISSESLELVEFDDLLDVSESHSTVCVCLRIYFILY
jgi:hypothetical protein